MHDILIRGGTLVDGTGSPGLAREVAVDGTKVAAIYREGEGKGAMIIEAKGLVVCPGFIDIHTHSDLHLMCCPLAESKIRQGVTTELLGNCGGSAAPMVAGARDAALADAEYLGIAIDWSSMDEYFLRLADTKTSVNVATLVGADTLRLAVVGMDDVRPTDEQLQWMNELLKEAMLQGAFGLSTGLIYAPGCYANTEEIVSMARTSAAMGGFYASHIRNESSRVVSAVEEAIRIGRESGSRVQISHHKACGRRNWGLVDVTLKMIDDARASGVDVAMDVYPYTASSTSLDVILPPWAREGSKEVVSSRLVDPPTRDRIKAEWRDANTSWENTVFEDGWGDIVVGSFSQEKNAKFENRSMSDVAKELGKDPAEAALDLLVEEKLGIGAVFHEMSEDDVTKVIQHPVSCIASDGESEAPYGPTGHSATHPRSYGTFPRVLRRYVFERRALSLEGAIRKMTAMPAERMGLKDRGLIAKGMAADIVMFDPRTVRDVATFEDSHRYADGIRHVLVNGQLTIKDGEHTRERAGQVIRHVPAAP
jgi:N-acyl-D-amino-acid deacylase